MKVRRVLRYISDCGRGYWSKAACLAHEAVCKCWTNPKNRTCKTCEFGRHVRDDVDPGADTYWECLNDNNPNDDHTGGPEGVDYISVHCVYWKGSK